MKSHRNLVSIENDIEPTHTVRSVNIGTIFRFIDLIITTDICMKIWPDRGYVAYISLNNPDHIWTFLNSESPELDNMIEVLKSVTIRSNDDTQ